MTAGSVKFFDAVKGFGYVELDDGRDVFVDRRALRGEGFRYLAAGEQVDVTLGWDAQRQRDVAVSVASQRERLQGQVTAFDRIFRLLVGEKRASPGSPWARLYAECARRSQGPLTVDRPVKRCQATLRSARAFQYEIPIRG